MSAGYVPRTIKRRRRTRAEIDAIGEAIYDILSGYHPMTVRQVFYLLTTRGVIDKTEAEYKGTVIRLLVQLRREGTIPFDWIADNTRWMRKPQTFTSVERAIEMTARYYRRDLWADAGAYVEIWCEKDALAGVIMEETDPYDVPLMVSRGFSSVTFLHSAAEAITDKNKPTFIYQFGDHDPSGVVIPQKIEQGLREFAPTAEIHFERVAVTLDQIETWRLPSRPTKRTDSRAKGFAGESVELDSIEPMQLRQLVADCIERHVDGAQWLVLQAAEKSERTYLENIAAAMQDRGQEPTL